MICIRASKRDTENWSGKRKMATRNRERGKLCIAPPRGRDLIVFIGVGRGWRWSVS